MVALASGLMATIQHLAGRHDQIDENMGTGSI